MNRMEWGNPQVNLKKRIILARLIVDSDERPVNAESVVAIIIVIKHRPIHE